MSEYAGYRRAPAVAAVVLSGTVAAFAAMAPAPEAQAPMLQSARVEPLVARLELLAVDPLARLE